MAADEAQECEELIARARGGDDAALGQLLERQLRESAKAGKVLQPFRLRLRTRGMGGTERVEYRAFLCQFRARGPARSRRHILSVNELPGSHETRSS